MLQDRFAAAPAQAFTSDGGADGTVSIASTSLFKVAQQVIVVGDALDNLDSLEVKRILTTTTMIVGPQSGGPNTPVDLSAYTVVANAAISANEQNRPVIGADEFERAVYEEEPTVAKRVILVDKAGNPYTASGGGGGGSMDQGAPNTPANAWPVKVTDGTDILAINADGSVNISDGGGSITIDGTVAVSNFPATQPVSGTVAVSNFPATQPISAVALPLPTGAATDTNQATEIANLQALNSLVPSVYDYISLAYTGTLLTTVVYKLGGAGGSTVSTLTLAYTGTNLTSVTKS